MSRIPQFWKARPLLASLVAAEGLVGVLAFAPGQGDDRGLYFAGASCIAVFACVFMAGSSYVLRDALGRASAATASLGVGVLVALGLMLGGLIAHALIQDFSDLTGSPTFWARLALTSAVVGLFVSASLLNFIRSTDAAIAARQAVISALQARIRPHFLFNTLNTGAALVHARPGEAERLLLDLSDLFRAALSGDSEIPLADELALARRYLEIEALRFGPRLRLGWDLPDPVPSVRVPTLSIQPLVENAIRHGVEPSADGSAVEVRVEADSRHVRIIVANDLPRAGFGSGSAHSGHQVGQAAVRSRIEALTEGRGRLEAGVVGGRYVATITLPR